MARLTGVGHALISGMSAGWMGSGSRETSIAASGAKVMMLCQRTVWHGMGPVRGLNRACCEDLTASCGHGQEGCIGLRARGAVQAKATHPEGEGELFIGVVGVDIFLLGAGRYRE